MEIWEINLTGKWICLYLPRCIQKIFPWKILPKGVPGIQSGDETTKTLGGRNSNMGHVGSKNLQEALALATSTLRPSLLGTGKKTLTNQAGNLVSQQGMPQSLENLLISKLALLACTN